MRACMPTVQEMLPHTALQVAALCTCVALLQKAGMQLQRGMHSGNGNMQYRPDEIQKPINSFQGTFSIGVSYS
jgi:hypothetical protein